MTTGSQKEKVCELCNTDAPINKDTTWHLCDSCQSILTTVEEHPEIVKKVWQRLQFDPILPKAQPVGIMGQEDLPDLLDGKRYRVIDRDRNKWYLSISEVEGKPVEIFASTAFDRDHELQSRISNLTTITRIISLILRHIFMGERITLTKCLKQIQRSSRQKNDLPDMLYGVLSRYVKEEKIA
ncbi:MAG: hypothetical protein OEM02_09330 [Desulfobulbaceae bacterium]|nr:hypothetical protein [Desulfobulbaceae bacterium]